MANNFRITTGIRYCSKAGNDTNNGTSPETPKASLNGILFNAGNLSTGAIVIGAGMYEEAANVNTTGNVTPSLLTSDGKVIFRGNGTNSFIWNRYSGSYATSKLEFQNYAAFNMAYAAFTDCTFNQIPNLSTQLPTSGTHFTRCIFINCTITGGNSTFESCIFYNSTVQSCAGMKNCYANGNSPITFVSGGTGGNYDYNNLMGNLRIGTGAYQLMAAHKSSNPTYNINSFSISPKFNNPEKLDFTLQFDSPHIGAASSGGNIGGTSYGVTSVFGTSPEWQVANGATRVNIDQSAQDAVISAGQTSGFTVCAPCRLFVNPTEIMVLQYTGQLMFNKSVNGGTASNNNVPDANVYMADAVNGGNNPDRLTIEMRWANTDEMPSPDTDTHSDWNNSGYGAPGKFYKFEINEEPRLYFNPADNLYYGSGSVSYIPANSFSFPVTWVQYRVTLTNAYINSNV